VPRDPRTTFNVGKIEGGTTVNSIAQTASMEVDLRSVSAAELETLDRSFKRVTLTALDQENTARKNAARLTVDIQLIGQRPVGMQALDAPIVQSILEADRRFGVKSNLTASSTDSGMPMRFGIPAVTIGSGGRGQGMHSLGESFDTTDSYLGTQRVLYALLSVAGISEK
jgi:acetylornithine deacetylase/succinyl-diaminopimelate desuccinylase-like protein